MPALQPESVLRHTDIAGPEMIGLIAGPVDVGSDKVQHFGMLAKETARRTPFGKPLDHDPPGPKHPGCRESKLPPLHGSLPEVEGQRPSNAVAQHPHPFERPQAFGTPDSEPLPTSGPRSIHRRVGPVRDRGEDTGSCVPDPPRQDGDLVSQAVFLDAGHRRGGRFRGDLRPGGRDMGQVVGVREPLPSRRRLQFVGKPAVRHLVDHKYQSR